MAIGKGQKRLRNQPVLHKELKKPRTIWLTTESWLQVQESAARAKISASEYVEQLIRKQQGE
ncbi:MAG: hypothetical protein PUP92_16225 [Rhizonema sp. PD38]|nr:hypothetical protein [Rhizonema sp. PD38]